MDTKQKLAITKAVRWGKCNDIEIAQIAELYALLQLGVRIDIDELDAQTVEMLLYYAQEVAEKIEMEAKVRK